MITVGISGWDQKFSVPLVALRCGSFGERFWEKRQRKRKEGGWRDTMEKKRRSWKKSYRKSKEISKGNCDGSGRGVGENLREKLKEEKEGEQEDL